MLRLAFALPLFLLFAACHPKKNEAISAETKTSTPESAENLTSGGTTRAAGEPNRCYNVEKAEPQSLSGVLEFVMFAGPPNFEDVQKGDTPEPTYILQLNNSICISDGDEGAADPSHMFDRVQVDPGKVSWQDLKRLVGKSVRVELYDQMAATTGHHHEPLLASVSSIYSAPPSSETIAQDDPTAEYGTPATTIRAFYTALRSGRGDVAANMIVPEKTVRGPFAPANLTKFYGNMRSPIELISVSPTGPNTFLVRYSFAVTRSVCNGRANVETTEINGKNYIARIQALDGC